MKQLLCMYDYYVIELIYFGKNHLSLLVFLQLIDSANVRIEIYSKLQSIVVLYTICVM